ncbi:unnamed protein product, partial [Closterium sp. NIES-64]
PILSTPAEPAAAPPAAPADSSAPLRNHHSESDPLLSHLALSPSVTTRHAAAAAAHASTPFALASSPLLPSVTLIGGYHVYSSHVYSNRAYSSFASTASTAGNLPCSLQSHVAPSIPNLPSRFLSSVPPVASQVSESASESSAEPAVPGSGLPVKPAATGSGIPAEPTGDDASAAGKDEDTTSVKVSEAEAEAEVSEILGGGNHSITGSPVNSSTTISSNSSSGINRNNRFGSGGEGRTGDGGSGIQAWKKQPRQRGSRQTGSSRDLRRGQLWGVISRVRSNNPVLPAIEAWRMAGGVLDKELLLWAIRRCQPYAYRAKAAELSQWLISSSGFPLTYLDYQLALACAARCNAVGTVREMFLSFPEEFCKEKVYVGVLHHFARRGRTHKLGEELEWLRNQGVTEENASYRSKLQALLTEQEIISKGATLNGADMTITSEGGGEGGGDEEEGGGGGGEEGEGGWNDADWFELGEGKEGSRKERLEKVLGDVDLLLQEMKEKGMMPDEVAYNIVLASLARLGQIEKMEAYLARMRADGGQPSGVSYNILIGAYALAGQFEKTDLCIEAMKEAGERLNVKTYWSLMGRYAKRGAVERFSKVWEEVKQAGLPLDRSMYHSRIEVHSRAGDLEKAEQAFNEMCALMPPTTASFNVLLAALGRAGRLNKIPAFMQSMQRWGRPRDAKTFVFLIDAFLRAGDEEGAMRALREAAAVGMQRNDQKLPFSSLIQVLIPARNKGDVVRVKEIIGLSRTLYKMTDPRLFRDLVVTIVNRWEKDKELRDPGEEGQLVDKEEDPSWKRLVLDIHGVLKDMKELGIEPTKKTYQILESLGLSHMLLENV